MPIYAYKCDSCGFAKDVLQKLSDAPLSQCPSCGGASFSKQLTAAGFQLKGSGWYATDFKGGATGAPAADGGKAASGSEAATESKPEAKKETGTDTKAQVKGDTKAADRPAPKKPDAAPAAGSGV
jgi:putative FmdB family regulatory protein